MDEKRPQPSTGRQVAWFIGLYLAGLLVMVLVAYFFRALLGLT
ncbi:MAG: DUF2474 domain-containing protein [Gammaproteobacteria bacterium]